LQPAPAATPLTAAMTGLAIVAICTTISAPASSSFRNAVTSPFFCRPLMYSTSPPAQNARPAPVRTITRTASSWSQPRSAARRSSRIVPVKALSFSGRLRVIVATARSVLTSINMRGGYHPAVRRPYFFELFTLANLAAIALIGRDTFPLLGSPIELLLIALGLLIQALAGVAVRSVVALIRRDRVYVRAIRSAEWLGDTLRLIVAGTVMVWTYGWIKLVVPVLHPRLFDQALWDLDRILFFGLSPNILFLDGFNDAFLRFNDWTYANIFYVSTLVAFAYFLSEPDRRVRVAFANGNAALWLIGAWLYMLVPSLGPAYRFPDIWFAHDDALRRTQALQAMLMKNYQNVRRLAAGQPPTDVIRIVFGIAAFPSLHVAFQTYVFLWMRRLWTSGEVIFAVFVLVIFLGSMVTGWHYMIDGIAGMALAWGCYALSRRATRDDNVSA
jgi:hypothetical protein